MPTANDFNQLRSLLVDATKACVADLFHRFPHETFYAFALYTVDELAGINPSASAESGFEKRKEKFFADTKHLAWLAEKKINVDSTLNGDYRWSEYGWEHECHLVDAYAHANGLLRRLRDEVPDDDFDELTGPVLASMVMALRQLDLDGVFTNGREERSITLFCSKPASDDTAWLESESGRLLNTPSVWQTFKKQRVDYISGDDDGDRGAARAVRCHDQRERIVH